jgi:hypothetical protein
MTCGARLERVGIALFVQGFVLSLLLKSRLWIDASCSTLQLK